MSARALTLWCALVVALGAATAYTVDCNHDYTDCDTELSKTAEDEELPTLKPTTPTTTVEPTRSTPKIIELVENQTENTINVTPEVPEPTEAIEVKPKPRLLNLNVDELQNFANTLHNQTQSDKKKGLDLSDVNLDDDEDDPQKELGSKNIPDKFYSNLQAPFHVTFAEEKGSEEMEMCKENGVAYKISDKIDRGCDESCECSPGGVFDCSPRCKHPYIRRGRRLTDPLCFESPVDDCCSIIACATGNGEGKPTKIEVCRYGNDTYPVGGKWYVGCEQSCNCETNSKVTCVPRCKPLLPSDKCINVQDPNDACCEVQVCDVSQDAHEIIDNVTTTTAAPTSQSSKLTQGMTEERSSFRPLILAEPIGSVKVLQNNTVQVNLIHLNISEDPVHLLLSNDGGKSFKDVELKYSNLILNLEGGKDYILKTKETGTKFNFTITATDLGANEMSSEDLGNGTKVGCWEDGKFYGVGEEFHIGCSELCECTGADTRECSTLVCPNHVGLELMSKGCVRWAPSPPAQPPNCCPRSARCLSDGTCHYNGVPVPNWTEVPISLTGCEQRCFCENGELDCQEVCTPLPPVPPQSMRCPPMHRPAPVNISDEDCCKQWGCVPSGNHGSSYQTYRMPVLGESINFVTPLPPISTVTTQVLPTPPLATDSIDFYKHLTPVKSFPKILKNFTPVPVDGVSNHDSQYKPGDNITVFTLEDIDVPFKTIHPEPPLLSNRDQWPLQNPNHGRPNLTNLPKSHTSVSHASHSHPEKHINFALANTKIHDIFHQPRTTSKPVQNTIKLPQMPFHAPHELIRKIPMSSVDDFDLFLPNHEKKYQPKPYLPEYSEMQPDIVSEPTKISLFQPEIKNRTSNYFLHTTPNSIINTNIPFNSLHSPRGKHVTVLRSKDLKATTPTYGEDALWSQGSNTHVLSKQPNPYETVLLRAIPSSTNDMRAVPNSHYNSPDVVATQKKYSTVNLEHLLSQMEVESEVNRNLGRSADKNQEARIGHAPTDFAHNPQPPSFLPTVPPEFHYPEDENPSYDQNNIHHPVGLPENGIAGLPPGLQVPSSFGEMNKKLSVISVESDSPTSVTMLLGLPSVLVGLRGSVDLRYTDTADEDISHWYSQVFAPADEILTTPRLEFRLSGLKPSTTYKIRGKLFLHNLPVAPSSEVYSVKTQDLPPVMVPALEKRKEIDSRLTIVDVNDTSAHVSWRHFTEDELQFIDGIQVRFRPVGTPIYSMTELLHHSRSAAELHDLRPGSRYEASLVLVPPPRATTELNDPGKVEFITKPYMDPYNWSVSIDARTVGAEAAELTWTGVPSPAERWVRVYRAAHACGDQPAGKEHDEFKLVARDQPLAVTLSGLEPNSRCRVWLELFLTNGKVKTSNVLEINTKSLDTDNPIDNEISASSISSGKSGHIQGDYYSALVGVGVVAALGALASLLLLLVVVRRHRPHSADITPVPSAPRESSLPPYDNPAYKLELQQETMGY